MNPGLLHGGNTAGKIGDAKNHAVPSTWFLLLPIRHRPRSGCPRAAEQNLRVAERDARERRQLLMFEREAQMSRIERDRMRDVLDLIADAMNGLHESVTSAVCRVSRRRRLSYVASRDQNFRLTPSLISRARTISEARP